MINAECDAGRVAADRICEEWNDRAWVPQSPTPEWAQAAIQRLSEHFSDQKGMFKASLEGAQRGARSLSPRPFQGLVECLQNADDLDATCLHIAYRALPTPELLIVHNGTPVTLANVAAMLLPWLSTKKDDADASGRFGIGQRTLESLGGPISVHAPPFHFAIHGTGPQAVAPYPDVPGLYQASRRDTLLAIPLLQSVTAEGVAEAVQQLNVDALLFLRSIRTLQFHHLEDPARGLSFSVEVTPRPAGTISFDGAAAPVEVVDVALSRGGCEPMVYRRYSTQRPVRSATARVNKATAETTPIGICVPLHAPIDPLPLYDRMPLPVQTGLFIGLNAQFDPDAARSTLILNEWNTDRFTDLGHLVSWAALEHFKSGDVAGWNHIPLAAEVMNPSSWISDRVLELVVKACHTTLIDDLAVLTHAGPTPVQTLAYESAELEQLLDEHDVESLCDGKVALPRTQRDGPGRWRPVLAELGCSAVIDVEDALEILEFNIVRPANWYVLFAGIVEQHHLVKEFTSRKSLLLFDGTTTALPESVGSWVLVESASPSSLASRLGLTRQLHPAYFADGADVEAFLAALKKRHVLFDHQDAPTDVFQILKRGSFEESADSTAIRLHDPELLALRDAWAELPRDQRDAIGLRVGQRIELKAFWYLPGGKRETGWCRPVELYMSAAVDRDTDSFAKAAGKTPNLKWVDSAYVKTLKPTSSRASQGARSLLLAWGVAREPRLIRPTDEVQKWTRDTRPASPVHTQMRTQAQLESIKASGACDYLLNDHWSPDAEAVAEDIARSSAKLGRVRGEAFLAVLNREWRRYGDAALALPVKGYNGYWNPGTEVRATWLARLAVVKWLPDAGNSLQCPSKLRQQPSGASIQPSERSFTLCKVDAQIYRSGVLAALSVRAGPTQKELVQHLRLLRDGQVTPTTATEALSVYQLLAASLRNRKEASPEGRMTPANLKNAFRAGQREKGLLLVDGQWHSPETLLRGSAIFGSHRKFAPHIEGLDALWTELGVPLPSATDAIDVLREISASGVPPSPADKGVMIRAFTLLANGISSLSTQKRTTLRSLPLWTGTTWAKGRPVYALEGESLQDAAPATINVWRLGLSTFDPIKPAFEALGIVHLSLADFQAESGPARGHAEGDCIRSEFARAVALLKQEFVSSDQGLVDSLSVSWESLAAAPVVINPNLTIVAKLGDDHLRLPARAHINREPLYLVLSSTEEAASDRGAGQAIASLFQGDLKKISWAWSAVWPRAVDGERPQGAVLSSTKAEQADDANRLEKLAEQAGKRSASKKTSGKPGSPAASTATPPPVQVRKLKDLSSLQPSQGTIVNKGAPPRGDLVFAQQRGTSKAREFDPSAPVPPATVAAQRSVLPPIDERERLALDAMMQALQLDNDQLNDLRNRRGVGVDAIDEWRQCFEIKMSSSAALPNDVTLTAREVEAAREDPDFFLAIVTGLEEGEGKLRVHFLFNPLGQLAIRLNGGLTLTGVQDAEKLEYEFG